MWRHQNPLEDQSNFLHHENFLQDWTWKIISDVIFNYSKNVIQNNSLLITRKMSHRMTHCQIKKNYRQEILKIWRKIPLEKIWSSENIFEEIIRKRFQLNFCQKFIFLWKFIFKFLGSKINRFRKKEPSLNSC